MKAAASPGETWGEVSEIAAKVAGGGGDGVQGLGEDVGTLTYFKVAFWVSGWGGNTGRGHTVCVSSGLFPTYTPQVTLLLHKLEVSP